LDFLETNTALRCVAYFSRNSTKWGVGGAYQFHLESGRMAGPATVLPLFAADSDKKLRVTIL